MNAQIRSPVLKNLYGFALGMLLLVSTLFLYSPNAAANQSEHRSWYCDMQHSNCLLVIDYESYYPYPFMLYYDNGYTFQGHYYTYYHRYYNYEGDHFHTYYYYTY